MVLSCFLNCYVIVQARAIDLLSSLLMTSYTSSSGWLENAGEDVIDEIKPLS